MPRTANCLLPVLGLLLSVSAATASGQPSRLMPGSVTVYAELVEPGPLLRQYLGSSLRKDVEAHPFYAVFRATKQYEKFAEGVTKFEKAAERTAADGFDDLLGGGLAIGLALRADRPQPDYVLLVRGRTPEKMRKAMTAMLASAIPLGAVLVPPPHEQRVFSLGEAHYALIENLFIISNNKDMAEQSLKLIKGEGAGEPLTKQPRFVEASKHRPRDARLWAWADMKALAAAAGKGRLFPEKLDNILGPMLVGGPMEIAARAEYVSAAIALDGDGVRFTMDAPVGVKQLPPTAAGMLVTPTGDAEPPLPARTLLHVRLNRDLGAIWANREHTVRNDQLAQLAELDNLLTNAFGGRDFGQEVLPGLFPDMQLLAVRQEFAGETLVPQIKLPAFAWVLHARKPESAQNFQKAFKKFVGLLSYILGEQAKGDVDLDRENYRDAVIWFMNLEPTKQTTGSILYNFSPAVVVLGDRVAITSTRRLARELIDLYKDGKPVVGAGDLIDVRGDEVHRLLEENREGLIAQNIASKGQTREQAAGETAAILSAVQMVRSVKLALEAGESRTRLSLEIKIRTRN